MTTRPRRLTRGVVAAVAVALAGALTLAACSPGETAAKPTNVAAAATDTRKTETITDELGRKVELRVPVKKVYTDLWYQTEVVRAIGAGNTIVGIDDTSSPKINTANAEYFKEFADTPSAGDYNEPNWEVIAQSGAEVFLARRNSPWQEAEEKLAPFGIKVVVVSTWDPKVLREELPLLGQIFGHEDGAAQVAALYDDIDNLLTTRLKGVEPKKVYFENNADNVTSVPGSGWHDAIVAGGGDNIFADVDVKDDSSANVHTYTIDPADVIARNPDFIIHNGVDGLSTGYAPWTTEQLSGQAQKIADRPGFSGISAVKNGNVFVFDNFFYSALGKQIGALAVAKWLHPDQFADVNLDDYLGKWLELQGVEAKPVSDYYYKLGS